MNQAKRWLPLAGSAVLVTVVVLRLLGQTEAAGVVEMIANATGISAQSPVSAGELAAGIAAGLGIVLKVISEVQKARQ